MSSKKIMLWIMTILFIAFLVLSGINGLMSGYSVDSSINNGINPITRRVGGTQTVKLPEGTKLVNATWDKNSLWYVIRPMRENENPENLTMLEDSTFGALQGKIIFEESK